MSEQQVKFLGQTIPFTTQPGMQQSLKRKNPQGIHGSIEYKGRVISGRLKNGDFAPDELTECGCCGGYHQESFIGDCRDDRYRFPTWDFDELIEDEGVAVSPSKEG